jgi:ribonuclease HI
LEGIKSWVEGSAAAATSKSLDSTATSPSRAGAAGSPAARKSKVRAGAKAKARPGARKLIAFTDGASRGNPGEAACAVVFFDEKNEELLRRSKRLGRTTNNVAEYEAVLMALELAGLLGARALDLRLDSELVVRQLNGEYKVKHPALKPLFERACKGIEAFEHVTVTYVPRAENALADELANHELDGKAGDP